MQRAPALFVLFASLLYLGLVALANAPASAADTPSAQATPEPARPGPHIAVLLPLKSGPYTRVADAVRRGIWEAYRVQPGAGLPLVIYATGDDPFDITKSYERAVRDDARLILGPLTRSAVSALAGSTLVSVPTLALNAPETDAPLPQNLYVFGLQVENEARQVAQLAAEEGRKRALVVTARTGLSKRLSQAFIEEWSRGGHQISEEFALTSDPAELAKLRDSLALGNADMVFLALDAQQAKVIRSYLGLSMPIYATSLVNAGSDTLGRLELNGVRFVDMPWLLVPDDPAVMTYTRLDPTQANTETQRFYALGIDAYRIALDLLKPQPQLAPLDGVTGRITLDRERRFIREPVPAQFVQGETKLLAEGRSR